MGSRWWDLGIGILQGCGLDSARGKWGGALIGRIKPIFIGLDFQSSRKIEGGFCFFIQVRSRIAIFVIIKTRLTNLKGVNVVLLGLIWLLSITRISVQNQGSNIGFDLIRSTQLFACRFDSYGDYFVGKIKETTVYYIKEKGMGYLNISITFYSPILFSGFKGYNSLSLTMTQSQLVGSSGEKRNGEGMRKRLKITVAHFDNTTLVKSCSKVLLGRCMNPVKQQMQALLTNSPKI
ncbi:Uncharacterized protein Rs2_48848 [Raphanus sativus]|nr:Uncharacterized protein Rs2_48848 [Raphanus sativus]